MSTLLVVHHSPSPSVQRLTDAVLAGACDEAIVGVEVLAVPALEATAEQVLAADGLVLGTPANFGYMSGALKHFFDRTFLQVGGSLAGQDAGAGAPARARLPYALYVHGRHDTTGAVRSVEAIASALPWRRVCPVLEVLGEVGPARLDEAYELGGTLGALLMG